MHQHVKKMCSNAQSHPEYLQNIKAVGGGRYTIRDLRILRSSRTLHLKCQTLL